MKKAAGSAAVMQRRIEAKDSLDDFPTPPWGTRALCDMLAKDMEQVGLSLDRMTVWEPCANRRIMADPLGEYFSRVVATDVHDYGYPLDGIGSFVGNGGFDIDVIRWPGRTWPDWIISNPPFRLSLPIVQRALKEARVGVAMLVRSAWLEGGERYEALFGPSPPAHISIFSERLPMVRGRWDPGADSATTYSWIIWRHAWVTPEPSFRWFPPGTRDRLTKPDDAARFGFPNRGDPPADDDQPEEQTVNGNAAQPGGRAPSAGSDLFSQ